MISSDLKWKANTRYIQAKFMKKLWIIRRIKLLGGSIQDLLLVYKVQLRCLTEMCCPAWNGALTQVEIRILERLQKIALKLILDSQYTSYEDALNFLGLDTLEKRRKKLSLKFARKTQANKKYQAWFTKASPSTRSHKEFTEPFARTATYFKSPLFYLIDLL